MKRVSTLLTILVLSSTASAQPGGSERHGLFAGGGLHGGNLSCSGGACGGEFREAGGVNGQVGYLLSPRLGLVFDVWAMTSAESNDVAITFVAATIGARVWLTPWLWVHGGLGSGHATVRVSSFGGRSDDVPAGELGAGVAVINAPGWSLDVGARVAQGIGADERNGAATGRMAGLGVSLSFYQRRPR